MADRTWPTKTECKSYSIGITEVTGASDDFLDAKITEAENIIHNFCEQQFDVYEEAETKYFNGNDNDTLWLSNRLTSLSSVVDSDYDFTSLVELKYGNNFSILESLYPVYGYGPRDRVRDRSNNAKMFMLGVENIEVKGNWGWDEVPKIIKNVAYEIVERLCVMRHDVRQRMTPFEEERMPDGYSYKKGRQNINGYVMDVLDAKLIGLLMPYKWNAIRVEKI